MTKSELVEELTLQSPTVSRHDMELVVNTIFDTMTKSLSQKHRIEIRGFGSLIAKLRKARAARNPRTGQSVTVPAKWVPFFTIGKELKERINSGIKFGNTPSPFGD